MMRRTIPATFSIAAILLSTMTSSSYALEIGLAHAQQGAANLDPSSAVAATFRYELGQRSGGTIRVNIFPDKKVGGNRPSVLLTRRNIIQSTIATVAGIAPEFPEVGVLLIPYTFRTIEVADAVYDGPFGRKLAAEIEKRSRSIVLGFPDGGGYYVISDEIDGPMRLDQRAVETRLRAIPGFSSMEAMIENLQDEAAKARASDDYKTASARAVKPQLDQVQLYMKVLNHIYSPYVWLMSREAFDSLSEADRAIVRASADSAIALGRKIGRANRKPSAPPPNRDDTAAAAGIKPEAVASYVKLLGGDSQEWFDALREAVRDAETKAQAN